MNKHIAIVCNQLAGSGRSISMTEDISSALTKRNYRFSIFINEWPEKFEGFTDIFIVGGDGTINYFINKYPAIQLPLVLFNGGTGNDFHWTLYNKYSFTEQIEIALTAEKKPIDIGKCNDRYFINGVGIGFEASISKALTGKRKLPGKTSFYIAVIKNIFSYQSKFYSIKTDRGNIKGKKFLIDIYNGCRAGGGFYVAPSAIPDDGLFDVISAAALNTFQRLRYLPVIEKGKHLGLAFINYFKTEKISIESDTMIQYHLDGEYSEAEQLEIVMLSSKVYFRY